MTKLEILLMKLDPINFEKDFNAMENAKANFTRSRNRLHDENYIDVLVEFMRDIWKVIFGNYYDCLKTPDGILYMRAMKFLEEVYPANAEGIVENIMETGIDGGLYKIYQILVDKEAENSLMTKNRILVTEFLDSISNEEKVEVVKEYIQKHRSTIPQDMINDVWSLYSKFDKVLLNHTRSIWNLRNLR